MIQLIQEIRDRGDLNLILSSHLLRDVEECCDEVLILKDGNIAAFCNLEEERRAILSRVAGLTAEQAKAEMVKEIENQAKREAALIVREIESEARREGEKRACKIVTLAVQRVGWRTLP